MGLGASGALRTLHYDSAVLCQSSPQHDRTAAAGLGPRPAEEDGVGAPSGQTNTATIALPSPVVELILIRHAQPAWTEAGVGALDPDLTEFGRRQSEALAERLAGDDPYDELVVSTAARAASTAEPIARSLGLQPV